MKVTPPSRQRHARLLERRRIDGHTVVRDTCTASSSPKTFGSAKSVATSRTPRTSKFFHSG